MIPCSVLL